MKFKFLFTLFLTIIINQTIYSSTSAPIKIIATIVNKDESLFEEVGKNVYHALVENLNNIEIIFNSESDILSFPKEKTLKPGEKQLFKFITENKENISLYYEVDNIKTYVKTYDDLTFKN